MIDSHCHLDREPLISNLSQVLTRAKDVGLEKLLTICTTSSGYNNILDIVNNYGFDDGKIFVLDPGDSIFIPEGVYHTPTVHSPRATVSFGLL